MDRINGLDWIDIGGGKRGFRGKTAAGLLGTEVTAAFLNAIQEEIATLIEAWLGPLNGNDNTQLQQAINARINALLPDLSGYLTIANAASTYLTIANAALTYLTQANAAATYLTQANAAATYLTQANAAATYLTQANAATLYVPQTEMAGAVQLFARNSPPAGWLRMNGALVSRTTYSRLFTSINTTFGAGDGSTTFALPEVRGEFLRAWDDGRGIDVGRAFGSAQAASRIYETLGNLTGPQRVAQGVENFDDMVSAADSNHNPTTPTAIAYTQKRYGVRPRNVAFLACIRF